MSKIILIETSTALCSTAIAENGRIITYRESTEPRSQASQTAVFIDSMLSELGISAGDCDAVCVSKGPGSYTGLRVGSSSAKGLCFGAGLPLIAVSTPEALVWQALDEGLVPEDCHTVVPMIDARRMEVYTATFTVRDGKADMTDGIEPRIIGQDSFSGILEEGKVLFIGDGALKCREVITSPNAAFVQCCPKASALLHPATAAYEEKRFEDVAYFEPFYLKEFVATVSRKNLF